MAGRTTRIIYYPDAYQPDKSITPVLGERQWVLALVDESDGSEHPIEFAEPSSAVEVVDWLRRNSEIIGADGETDQSAKWYVR